MIRSGSRTPFRVIRWGSLGMLMIAAAGSGPLSRLADPTAVTEGGLRHPGGRLAGRSPLLVQTEHGAGPRGLGFQADMLRRPLFSVTLLPNARWPTSDAHQPRVRLVNNEPLTGADEQIAWTSATNQVIQFYQSGAARDPKDPTQYRSLGAAYMQKARETGDVTYFGLAEKALKQALALHPTDRVATGVLTRLALVALSRHEFPDALAYTERAIGYGTGQLFPYAILGDMYFEIGEYEKAAEAYAKLTTLTGAAYPSTRLAALHVLRGNTQGAVDETERGIETLLADKAPRENVAWAEFRLGELLFNSGDLAKAETA